MKNEHILYLILCVFIGTVIGCKKSEIQSVRALAEAGDANAQLTLGRFYADGLFVTQDDAMASKWYLLAAKQGQADAQVYLGMAYESGRGVSKDYIEAYAWFDVASACIANSALRRDRLKALLNLEQLEVAQVRAHELPNGKIKYTDYK